MKKFEYVVTDPAGIHARPAGEIVCEAGKFSSEITIGTDRKAADARQLIRLMDLGIRQGTTIKVEAAGNDEEAAAKAMKKLFEKIKL